MRWLKGVWHDPVWSKVISVAILACATAVAAIAWPPLRGWTFADITLTRSQVIAWAIGGVILGIVLCIGVQRGTRKPARATEPVPAAQAPPPAPPPPIPESALEPADWNVLYVVSQRPDPEHVRLFTILAITGLSRLRAEVALDRLRACNYVVANGTDRKSGDKLFGIIANGLHAALKIHRERAQGTSLPPDILADMVPTPQRILNLLRLNHAPGCWMTVDELASATRLTRHEVETAVERIAPAEVIEKSEHGVRLSELGEMMHTDHA